MTRPKATNTIGAQEGSCAHSGDDAIAARRRAAAARALAEAALRRAACVPRQETSGGQEKFGRQGLDPVRFGDWEVRGIATDF
jgi:hypothetical protein